MFVISHTYTITSVSFLSFTFPTTGTPSISPGPGGPVLVFTAETPKDIYIPRKVSPRGLNLFDGF